MARTARLVTVVLFILWLSVSCSRNSITDITILQTTDLHGTILPYDYIENREMDVSLAHVASYVKKLRSESDVVVLLDCGDILQGQPLVYYHNFIDTVSPHIVSEALNWLKYDAETVGNHDIEAGHSVYDKVIREYDFPLLGANAVDIESGKPYFTPYVILNRSNLKIAVFGLITPAVPDWLPPELYSGIEFRDMVETAEKWMPEILKQKPDLVVGLFHAGWNSDNEDYKQNIPLTENGSAAVAYNVPGFDIIFTGHDHRAVVEKFVNRKGDTILILNAGSRSENIARADVSFSGYNHNGKKTRATSGKLIEVKNLSPDPDFIARFKSNDEDIREYSGRIIGESARSISTRDSYFGSSAFVDMLHSAQLEITGADISFAAPLSFDVRIDKGPIRVSDLFKLYRYENLLYTITMSGEEIKKYLEFSYGEWLNTMKSPDDYLLKYRTDKNGKPVIIDGETWLKNPSYDFDSAVGIDYTVDITRPEGDRIRIISFSDGRRFEMKKNYRVAVNSYRGNGGGRHLTEGAGIDKEELSSRLLFSTERDLRYYILKSIEEKKTINPKPLNNWKIIPEEWVKKAAVRERRLLFGKDN
jgi:2',3'-cyclic-nucleotide 2'-phosphodiesterase/3'-nucleotidase